MSLLIPNRSDRLEELVGSAITDLDIPDALNALAVERYEDVGSWLDEHWSVSPDDGVIYPQGSFRLGTVVRPINPTDHYDIDLVCRRNLLKDSTTPIELKRDVGAGMHAYVATEPDGQPTCDEGKRCWTLDYRGEPFHMDILPAIPSVETASNAIWLTDKTLLRWQPSNPVDFASWFHARMREAFLLEREVVAKRMEVEDVPDWRVKTPLQRTVQALKRHRDIYFAEKPEDRPASIIITTLAALAYSAGGSLYETLIDVSETMPKLVEARDGVHWVANPVHPTENFADRWRGNPARARNFFDWIEQAHADFSGYGVDDGIDRVLTKLSESFGEAPAKRAGELMGLNLTKARDTGVLGVSGAGLLGLTASRSVPRHTFHGDPPAPQ